ncbi:glycolate oxidase subunit GlcE [Nitrosomonas sp.]|uniref:glycolate oxidase subunit GlcE n=1 Tax=Nitrosomonas sp. TaxID=42353 RepID=UPI001DA47067|nr:glycolate oxidase subunit GlcE [Nitrosomonas sp.]MBX9636903.1 glycolate oxidase subunit GlcE [Nitrosomonas sp.]MBY0484956.1 glycolate oxidase subunit GlcE [Nitrosomonas sp.]
MQAIIDQYKATIRAAAEQETPLQIRGGGTKDFYGNSVVAQNNTLLDATAYSGIIDYEPTELVITARAGTRLADLEAALDQKGQMLAFEPPYFGAAATLGGCIAAGLSGPRRASAGSVRDFVLGVRMLNGKGDDLNFGGQVMKNVAGYDVSRLMVGAMGTLGMLLEVSLKVLPKPVTEITLHMQMDGTVAIERMNQWAGKPLPISATCYRNGELLLRLSGAESAVRAAQLKLGGEELRESEIFWRSIREQTHGFFQSASSLWRLSINPTTPPLNLPAEQLIEWNGGLRWLLGDEKLNAVTIHKAAKDAGGHATLFRSNEPGVSVLHPLDPGMMKIHCALKEKFDPSGILNPGRLYPEM